MFIPILKCLCTQYVSNSICLINSIIFQFLFLFYHKFCFSTIYSGIDIHFIYIFIVSLLQYLFIVELPPLWSPHYFYMYKNTSWLMQWKFSTWPHLCTYHLDTDWKPQYFVLYHLKNNFVSIYRIFV